MGHYEASVCSKADAIYEILAERGKTHGDFGEQAWIAQELKEVVTQGPNWSSMTADKRESIHMILHKISRIVCGNPDFKDTWDDIQGYARLISDKLPLG